MIIFQGILKDLYSRIVWFQFFGTKLYVVESILSNRFFIIFENRILFINN